MLISKNFIIGLVAAIFLGLSMLSGFAALFPKDLKNLIKPIFSKFFHNLFALTSFVFGFIAMIIAYNTRSFARNIDPGYMRHCMIGFLSVILAITLLAPLKAFFRHVGVFMRPLSDVKVEKETSKTAENGNA